ncbi:MAG TPA: SPOR domain-containing protein [Bacteroidales bacterium]|nr:SPOR domain-containing protein [Bacteroidales bacterium]
MIKSKQTKIILSLTILILLTFSIIILHFSPGNYTKYQREIKRADKLLENLQLEEAKIHYHNALNYLTDASHPQNQIHRIDSILLSRHLETLFNSELQTADSFFIAGAYEQARIHYTRAGEVAPHHSAPIVKLEEIEAIMNNQAEKQKRLEKPFHIVVGVFENAKNLEQTKKMVIQKGGQPLVIYRKKLNLQAVTYNSYSTLQEAYNNLAQIKKLFTPDAWILYHSEKQ